ncbi:MAG: transposase [Desulfovibrio sp.]|nr:transposase [Desulfovibrio sp.]
MPAEYTSRAYSNCSCADNDNRPSTAVFKCTPCSFEINANLSAALNMLRQGMPCRSVWSGDWLRATAMEQEAACGAAQ